MQRAPLGLAILIGLAPAGPSQAAEEGFSAPLDPAVWTTSTPLRGASVTSPVADGEADDGAALRLTYPGPTAPRRSGPGWSTEVETDRRSSYGRYEARLKAAPAQGRAGLVSAFFTYFNDGGDHNGDGVADNSEIDVELLAAEPSVAYLTVWTDYEVIDGVERFQHTATRVDLATGRVWRTEPGFEGAWGHLVEVEGLGWSIPGFDASAAYHTFAFDWQPDHVTFTLDDGSGPRALWRFDGAPGVTIPDVPAYTMLNLWHNDSHWDTGLPATPPRSEAVMWVDWVGWR